MDIDCTQPIRYPPCTLSTKFPAKFPSFIRKSFDPVQVAIVYCVSFVATYLLDLELFISLSSPHLGLLPYPIVVPGIEVFRI